MSLPASSVATRSLSQGPRAQRTEPLPDARERILHASARLFRQHGYKGTTVRDIAEAVGILSGSLFHHFRSKDEILYEIMREAAFTLCIRAEDIAARLPAPRDQARELISLELEWLIEEVKRDYLGVLVLEWREVSPAAQPEFTRLHGRYHRLWKRVLEACDRQSPLRVPPHAAAHILHGAMMSAMTWYRPDGRYSPEEFGDMLMRLVFDF